MITSIYGVELKEIKELICFYNWLGFYSLRDFLDSIEEKTGFVKGIREKTIFDELNKSVFFKKNRILRKKGETDLKFRKRIRKETK